MFRQAWINSRSSGKCASCGSDVCCGSGFVYRDPTEKVVCSSVGCSLNLELTSSNAVLDGSIVMLCPSSSERIAVSSEVPSAVWRGSHWEFRPEDILGAVSVAKKLGLWVHPDVAAKSIAASRDGSRESSELEARGLYPFQAKAVSWLRAHRKAILADDMGLGKTISASVAMPEGYGYLVVSPASLKLNWQRELASWRPELKCSVLKGRSSFRYPDNGEVIVTNYDILDESTEIESAAPPCKFCLVMDEAQAVKGTKTRRSKSSRAIARQAEYAWALTGTPMMGSPKDLWGLLYCLGIQDEVFSGWGGFCRAFSAYNRFFPEKRSASGKIVRPARKVLMFRGASPEVQKDLRRVMLRRKKEDVLPELPRIRYKTIPVELGKQLSISMDKCWESFRVESKLNPDRFPDFSEFASVRKKLASSRIRPMLEIVQHYEDACEPLIVFSAHRHPILKFLGRAGWGVITGTTSQSTRNEVVSDFQSGKLIGIAATIKVAGVGFTLTRASHILFVDLSLVPSENSQAEDRVRRIGQASDSILVSVMTSNHVLDQHVLRLLTRKSATIATAIS